MSTRIDTPVDICNLALDDLGESKIASIETPVSITEETCARHYDLSRKVLLRVGGFNFATKRASLARVLLPQAFGDEALFQKPNDYINLLSFHSQNGWMSVSSKRDYKIEAEHIVVFNGLVTGDTLNVRYTSNFEVVTKFDPLFITALRHHLAASLAYTFKRSNGEVDTLMNRFEKAMAEAMAVDGRESPLTVIKNSRFILNSRMWDRDPRFY
jgi:hypothetical protein